MTDPTETPPLRLLIVDDDPWIHDDFRKILAASEAKPPSLESIEAALFPSQEGGVGTTKTVVQNSFRIDSAFDGEKAVQLVQKARQQGHPFGVAFVDVRTPPGLDGIETISRIWRADPELQVVLCTAYSDHSWIDMVSALGNSDSLLVLRKPFDAIEVLQMTRALARQWVLARETHQRLADLERLVSEQSRELDSRSAELRAQVERRTAAESALEHLATHDALTGVPNRVRLREQMTSALSRARRHGSYAALLIVSLGQFKEVNSMFGRGTGDELLRSVTARLRSCVRASDAIARMGGDEFAVLLEDLVQPDEAAIVANRVLATCTASFDVCGHSVLTPPSIGLAVFPNDCSDPETLLRCADLAAMHAKRSPQATIRTYTDGMLANSHERMKLRERLGRAVEHNELELWYQPLFDLRTGSVAAVEALLRWNHPELGLVLPAKFVPSAERSGAIVPIGAWVLETACRQMADWSCGGVPPIALAVNVSAKQIASPGFLDLVTRVLGEVSLDPSRLELELTESAALGDSEQCAGVFTQLAGLGIRLAIDDFGSGYSSLLRLRQTPISVVKIDEFFLRDIGIDSRDATIVRAVASMARGLGMTVVAEGVNTVDQLGALRQLGGTATGAPVCDRVQGFLLGRPLPAPESTTVLHQLAGSGSPWLRSDTP
ncbi:MAG: EAL domain-containing protein [Polyangiaceae bacterium]|nr:EAL domain-containing protein [Polyangiaceae bacterium]